MGLADLWFFEVRTPVICSSLTQYMISSQLFYGHETALMRNFALYDRYQRKLEGFTRQDSPVGNIGGKSLQRLT